MKIIYCIYFCGFLCAFGLMVSVVAEGDPNNFFSLIRNEGDIDLVIMIDRSTSLGARDFHLVAKQLVYDIIRHYLWIKEDGLRISLATFAQDVTVIVNSIGGPDRVPDLNKCQLFYDEDEDLLPGSQEVDRDSYYWNQVVYDADADCVYLEEAQTSAYNMTHYILTEGKAKRPDAVQILLMVGAPVCGEIKAGIQAKQQLLDKNVYIFTIEAKHNEVTDSNQYEEWRDALKTQPTLLNYTTGGHLVPITKNSCMGDTGYCDTVTGFAQCDNTTLEGCIGSTCRNGGICSEDANGSWGICICPWGYTGRFCKNDVRECDIVENACTSHEYCKDDINAYTCENDNYPTRSNCTEVNLILCKEDEEDSAKWLIIGIPVAICVLIVLCSSIYAFYKICCSPNRVERRRRVAATVRRSVSHIRRSVVDFGKSKPPAVPPKSKANGTSRPPDAENGASAASSAHSTFKPGVERTSSVPMEQAPGPHLPPLPPIPLQDTRPRHQPPAPAAVPVFPSDQCEPPPCMAPRPPVSPIPPVTKPKPLLRPPAVPPVPSVSPTPPSVTPCVVLPGMQRQRESCPDPGEYVDPDDAEEEPSDPYHEFEDFYDFAWKTGELQADNDYLYLVSDSSTLPLAPSVRMVGADRQTRRIASDGYGWAPLQQGMLEWQNYICDLTSSNDGRDLDRVCIMQIDGQRWIASDNSLRPTSEQMSDIWRTFHLRYDSTVGAKFEVGSGKVRTFYIQENDGTMFDAVGGKDGHKDEVLVAARTKKFIILGGLARNEDTGICKEEVSYMKGHLVISGS